MLDYIFLFLYIFSVGLAFSVFTLSLLYWMRKKSRGRFHTLLFVGYLNILFFLAGLRFYFEGFIGNNPATIIGLGMAESLGYAFLIYYIPATINHILGRSWTPLRLTAVITACTIYFAVGTAYLLTSFLLYMAIIAALIFLFAMIFILTDAVRSIKKINKITSRVTIIILALLSAIFLPLILAGKVMTEIGTSVIITPNLRFLYLTIYYFWISLTGIVFYMKDLAIPHLLSSDARNLPSNLPLTEREWEVARDLAKGLTYGEIADELDISPHTVRNHVANVYKKLTVRSKVELIGVLRGEKKIPGFYGSS